MLAIIQFAAIVATVLISRRLFSDVLARMKQQLENKKKQKLQSEKEYEIKQQQKRAADKTPYELKKDEIQKMEEEIVSLKKEGEQHNSTDSYVKYSKIQRQILKLTQQLEKDRLQLENLKKEDEAVRKTQTFTSEDDLQWMRYQQDITREITQLVNDEPAMKKKERLVHGFLPLLFIFIFSYFPIILQADITSTLYPLDYIIGQQVDSTTLQLSNIIWVFVCFRVISIIHDYFMKQPSLQSEQEKKEN